jgi:predicted nucleotidyltransferase
VKYEELVLAIRDLAVNINADVGLANWYLFGSAREGLPSASDIDLLVICQTHGIADTVRRAVDVDQFDRPIHLSILTRAEEAEVCFVKSQGCIQVI